jgi:hypothetical protein
MWRNVSVDCQTIGLFLGDFAMAPEEELSRREKETSLCKARPATSVRLK